MENSRGKTPITGADRKQPNYKQAERIQISTSARYVLITYRYMSLSKNHVSENYVVVDTGTMPKQ